MSNTDSAFYNVRFDAVTQTMQYAQGSSWVDVPGGSGGGASGADGDIQFAAAGAFASNDGFNFDGSFIDVPSGMRIGSNVGGTASVTSGFGFTSLNAEDGAILHMTSNAHILALDTTGLLTLPADMSFAAANVVIKNLTDGINAIDFTMADGTTSIISLDTSSRRVGIFTKTPAANGFTPSVDIEGDIKLAGYMDMGAHNAACLINMVNPFAGLGVSAMTTAQKTALSPNRAGNVVFDTDLGKLCVNNGSAWETITSV